MKNILKSLFIIFIVTLSQFLFILIFTYLFYLFSNMNIDTYFKSNYFKTISLIASIIYTLLGLLILNRKLKDKIKVKKFLIYLIFGIIFSLLVNVIVNFITPIKHSNLNLLLILETGILGPIFEEIIYRDIIYNTLLKFKYPVILTSLLFALSHNNLIQIIYTFILGIILNLIYEKESNLKYNISFHIGFNILSILLTFIF